MKTTEVTLKELGVIPENTIVVSLSTTTTHTLKIPHDLDLEGSGITSLPDGLIVYGNLSLKDTPIDKLPDMLRVTGNLDLRGTNISCISTDVSCTGLVILR
jgi:hypothetical protein